MSEPQPEDSFSTALAEIERLLVVWDKLTTARVSVSATTRLIHQSIANLSLPGTYFDDTTFFPNFLRLVEIRNELVSRGITGSSLIKFMAEEFEGIKNAHSSWHNDGTPKSALRFLNSLDHWTTLNTMLENVSPTIHTIRGWITNIKGIISLDVKALPLQLDVSPDSLQLIEVGAGLLQALPHQHRAKISQVVDSQMKALTASSACTFGLNYEHDTASRAVLESNDDLIDLEAQTGNELSQIHRLQEQILQLKADNNELQQEKTSLTEEKTRLEGRVQSSETEMFGLKLRINNLQFEYAGLEEKFTTSKDEHQIAIQKFEDKVAGLQQALDSCKHDDRIYDESFQSRAEKLTEELAEAEEDKATLTRDVARLTVEKASVEETLAEAEDSKTAMSNEIHELGTKNDRLEQELKDASDSLEVAEDDRATLSRNVEKLTSENAGLKNFLRQISSFSASIRPIDTGDTDSALQTANANDETDSASSSTGMLTPASSTSTTPR